MQLGRDRTREGRGEEGRDSARGKSWKRQSEKGERGCVERKGKGRMGKRNGRMKRKGVERDA